MSWAFLAVFGTWWMGRRYARWWKKFLIQWLRLCPKSRIAWAGLAALGTAGTVFWISASPLLALSSLAMLPALTARGGQWRKERRLEAIEASAISFLHALLGLLRSGLSLPAALFQLSETLPTPFGRSLQNFLLGYEKGKTLHECLARFREAELGASAGSLALLEMAYRNGLPLAPLLEKILPVLEAERLSRAKLLTLGKSTLAQAGVAFFLPWLLAAVLGWFQPQLIVDFVKSAYLIPLLAFALAWEGVGVYLIWRISKFY